VIIDQFEQWLHAHREDREAELVAALRQCDGGRLQAVVMVRDDFSMAAARFMDALDVPMIQGHNFATVDLFDVRTCREGAGEVRAGIRQTASSIRQAHRTTNNHLFDAASGLAQDGKVVSVRLALFAEMVKGKPWVLGHTGRGRWHFRHRRQLSGRDFQFPHRKPQTPPASAGGPRSPEVPAARKSAATSRAICGHTASCWRRRDTRTVRVSSMICCGFWTANCG
jgi:hypothetical protein